MNFIQRGIISFLALLMFTTSACFAVDIHRCGDVVKSRSFFSRAESCEMMAKKLREENKELPECCKKYAKAKIKASNSKRNFTKKPCCVNESFSFKKEVLEDGQPAIPFMSSLVLDLPVFFALVESELLVERVTNPRINAPPDPDLKQDILSLFQVFII
jgi:hypothetical protein